MYAPYCATECTGYSRKNSIIQKLDEKYMFPFFTREGGPFESSFILSKNDPPYGVPNVGTTAVALSWKDSQG